MLRSYWDEAAFSPIRALVTYKSELDERGVHPGDPPFFMVHLLDETGEIRAHVSSGTACELYDRLQEGKVYYIHNVDIGPLFISPFYNLTHPCTLHFLKTTVIEEVS